jgi:small subunit ribosomal protein S3
MGQKVHPIGIRLGITCQPSSHWYEKKAYCALFVKEDRYIRDFVCRFHFHCTISQIVIERRGRGVRVRILSSQIGVLVGSNGKTVEKLRWNLQQRCQCVRQNYFRRFRMSISQVDFGKIQNLEIQVFVQQLRSIESDAQYLADFIVSELEKRVPFRRVLRMARERAKNQGRVRGLRLQISGRLNGSEIARTEWVRGGRVPLHTFHADLSYVYNTAYTIYGMLGVKVWIFRPLLIRVFIVLRFVV